MGTLLQILSNPSVVAAIVGALAWVGHKVVHSTASKSTALAHAIAATRSIASSIVATIAPTASPDELAGKVVSAGHAILNEAGIDPSKLSPIAAAMLNAVAHEAVDAFITTKSQSVPSGTPPSDALHAAIVNLSKTPPAKAA